MYITVSDTNIMLWVSGEDTFIAMLIWIAEAKINSYLWTSDLNSKTYTNEEYDFNSNIYYLKNINPTSITSINSVSPWDYKLYWRKLQLITTPTPDSVWNKIKITYVAWFSPIPEDIKAAAYNLVWFLYNTKKSQGINSFTQWQLTVKFWNYRGDVDNNETINNILSWLNKYKKNIILSI